jgi:FkbM family methyltransferase
MIGPLAKPWYFHRPGQLLRRLWGGLRGLPTASVVVPLPWGVGLEVDPREAIGRAIWTTGVYDLAVSETLFRLTRPGDLAIDAGANIGFMTGLMAVRAGPGGRVIAFEPQPVLAGQLRGNVARIAQRPGAAEVEVRQTGLSDVAGTARLIPPTDASANHGLAHIGTGEGGWEIVTERLDDVIGDATVGVLKVDVEGHESAVLAGAAGLLGRRAIRHVVFEDHAGAGSDVQKTLTAFGYRVFSLGWRLRGPVLGDPAGPPVCQPYEAPSYLATADPAEVDRVMGRPGWDALRPPGV